MPTYRSRTTTQGRNQAGARALWRATGMTEGDFEKPIIAVVNSFTQFVPGHVHLKDSSIGNNECKRSNSIDSRSMSIGSIESITMEEKDNIGVKTNKNKNK